MNGEFICPKCGSKEAREHMMVSREPPTEKTRKILGQVFCSKLNVHPVKIIMQTNVMVKYSLPEGSVMTIDAVVIPVAVPDRFRFTKIPHPAGTYAPVIENASNIFPPGLKK